MDFSLNQVNDSVKEIVVKLSFDEIKDKLTRELKKRLQNIQIDGFRKGKVPQHIVKRLFGDALELEASEKVANNFFWDIVEKENIKVIDRPTMTHLDFKNGEKLDFKITFETIPTIEVKEYQGIEIEAPYFQTSDDEVEQEIKHYLKENMILSEAEIIGETRDFIFEAEIIRTDEEGNPLRDLKPEILTIDLSKEGVHPDIIENAKAKKVGDTFSFVFTDFPKHDKSDSDKRAGEKYLYLVKILSIKSFTLPELNEDFVKKVTNNVISNPEDFKEDIKSKIQKYYDKKFEQFARAALISEIVLRNDFVPPQSLVKKFVEDYKQREKEYPSANQKLNDKKEASEALVKLAENDLKWFLIKEEIIKKENITVSDEALEQKAKIESQQTGLPVEKLVNFYKSQNQIESILEENLFKFLFEKNSIKKVNPDKFFDKKVKSNEQTNEQ